MCRSHESRLERNSAFLTLPRMRGSIPRGFLAVKTKNFEFVTVPELSRKIGLPILNEYTLNRFIEEDGSELKIYNRGRIRYIETATAKKWVRRKFGLTL